MNDIRLENPFTPKSLASGEGEFFGRSREINKILDEIKVGHIAIHGPVGIGKSSLLARISRIMQGELDNKHRSILLQGVCNKEIKTADDAAAIILSSLPPQQQTKYKWKWGITIAGGETETTTANMPGETAMTALRRYVIDTAVTQKEYLIIVFDQAENCPTALTALVRTLTTSVELKGCRKLRLILAGVSPYFDRLTDGDTGVNRLFSQIRVLPLQTDEALNLVDSKFSLVVRESEKQGISVSIHPKVPEAIVRLSGGHPHVIQLLGSYSIQHENSNPDDLIDSKDLVGAVRRICYDDRGDIYDSIIETLESIELIRPLEQVLAQAKSKHPTIINRADARSVIGDDFINEFIKRDILARAGRDKLGLVDEFLGLRLILDQDAEPGSGQRSVYDDADIFKTLDEEDEDENDQPHIWTARDAQSLAEENEILRREIERLKGEEEGDDDDDDDDE